MWALLGAPPEREGQAGRGDMFWKAWGLPVGTALISPRSSPQGTSCLGRDETVVDL